MAKFKNFAVLLSFLFVFVISTSAAEVQLEAQQEPEAFAKQTGLIEARPFLEFVIKTFIKNGVKNFLDPTKNNLTKFVTTIDNFLGSNVLLLNATHLQVSYDGLVGFVKIQAGKLLEIPFGNNFLILQMTRGMMNSAIDDNFSKFRKEITALSVPLTVGKSIRNGLVSASSNNIFESVLLEVFRPLQPTLDEAFVNVNTLLLDLYKPVLPSDYFQSLIAFWINRTVTSLANIFDQLRAKMNELLVVEARTTSNLRGSPLDFLIAPIRMFVELITSTIHRTLRFIINYIFATLRPVVGGIVLSPLQNLLMAIINIIPCSTC